MNGYHFSHGPTEVFQVSMRQARDFRHDLPWSNLLEIGMVYAVYLGSFVAVLLTPSETNWRLIPFAMVMLPLAYYSLAGSHDVHAKRHYRR